MSGDSAPHQPSCRRHEVGWLLTPSPPPEDMTNRVHSPHGHCAPARQPSRHYARSFLQATATLAPEALCSSEVVLSSPSSPLTRLSRQSGALSTTSRSSAVIRRVFAIRSGLGWAPDLPHFETSILSLVPLPLRLGAPEGACIRFLPLETLAFALFSTGSVFPLPTVGHESTPRRGLLETVTTLQRFGPLRCGPKGLLAPLDQPTSTPLGPGRRAL